MFCRHTLSRFRCRQDMEGTDVEEWRELGLKLVAEVSGTHHIASIC